MNLDKTEGADLNWIKLSQNMMQQIVVKYELHSEGIITGTSLI
jgi:hypothetical protein